jgi:hypothetical protein
LSDLVYLLQRQETVDAADSCRCFVAGNPVCLSDQAHEEDRQVGSDDQGACAANLRAEQELTMIIMKIHVSSFLPLIIFLTQRKQLPAGCPISRKVPNSAIPGSSCRFEYQSVS